MFDAVSNWGGTRQGAGRKTTWNHGTTKLVKFPVSLVADIARYARLIDGSYPNGLDIESALSCSLIEITQSRELSCLLQKVRAERDRLDAELNELHAVNGQLLLEIEELKSLLEYATQSSDSSGTGNSGEMVAAIADLQLKIEQRAKGYTSNSFTQGIKVIMTLCSRV